MQSTDEHWKPVSGYEGIYEVSDHGNVKSLARVVSTTNRWGPCIRTLEERILVPYVDVQGYPRVKLSREGRVIRRGIHQLVAEAFHGSRPEGTEVCHINGDPADNSPANLRYGSTAANAGDRNRHGRTARGESNGWRKITEQDVRDIRALHAGGHLQREIAKIFGINQQNVSNIVNRRSWAHID